MATELVPLGLDDVDAVHALMTRWERHWRIPLATPRREVEEQFRSPGLVPEADTRGIWLGGRLAGYAVVSHVPSGVRQERAFLFGKVDPDLGGNGFGRRLLAWSIERAVDHLRQRDPALPWYVRVYEWEWVAPSFHLYRRFGLIPARWFEELTRPLDAPIDDTPVAGVTIRPWEEDDAGAALDARNQAFAGHWGSTPVDPEGWRHLLGSDGVRPDLSWVAVDGSDVIGICLNAYFPGDEEVTGRRTGWIEQLAVVDRWRGRGVGGALLTRSMQTFRREGFTHAGLDVDTENPSGAPALYRRLGFEPLHRTVSSELLVDPISY
jgi:mycothiol synthase